MQSTVLHTGVTPRFEALAMLMPSEGKDVVVLVNLYSGFGFNEN